MTRFFALALAAALALPFPSAAHEVTAGALQIIHPMAYETAPSVKVGGGFMVIANEGEEDDALIGVKADFPKVMIHETIQQDGVARMQHVERIEIPAGETVELAPGGYHVMFMGVSEPLKAGETFPATLVFEKAGEVQVMFHIEERTGKTSGHSH